TREKVDRVEQLMIQNDGAVGHLVNPDDLDQFALRWLEGAERISPTVRSVLILDDGQRLLRHVSRAPDREAAHFRALFRRRILPELRLAGEAAGAHRHLHQVFDGQTVMISTLVREVVGRRFFVLLETDLDYVRGTVLRGLFDEPGAVEQFSVLDEDGRLV